LRERFGIRRTPSRRPEGAKLRGLVGHGPDEGGEGLGLGDPVDAQGAVSKGGGRGPVPRPHDHRTERPPERLSPPVPGGLRFLLVSVALEPADGDVESLAGLENKLRASLIPILSARTVDELLDLELRKELVREVTRTLEGIVGGEGLRKVFFPQFVIQ